MYKFFFTSCLTVLLSIFIYGQEGFLDDTFIPDDVLSAKVICTAIQDDDKVIVGGWFTAANGSGLNRIARFNTDGSVDNTFIIGSGFSTLSGDLRATVVRAISIQEDGKIIVGGSFLKYNNDTINNIVRLNVDGSIDETFNPFISGTVSAIAIQNDGKIVVGGNFLDSSGSGRNHIARLNSDGSFDEDFNSINGFDTNSSNVLSITLQPDGKIIIGGNFSEYDGITRNKIVRLNSNGSIDTSFNPGTGFNSIVYSTALQNDGKILVGGWFFTFNGVATNYITRLNSDGSIDESFNVGHNNGFDDWVNSIKIQSDNKIIVGGHFSEYNNEDIKSIARLNTDGTLDNTFKSEANNLSIRTVSIQNDGKVIVAGDFYFFNNSGDIRNNVARLNASTLGVNDENLDNLIQLFPNPTSDKTVLQIPNKLNGEKIIVSNALGQIIDQREINDSTIYLDFGNHKKGIYLIQIITNKGNIIRRVMKQ